MKFSAFLITIFVSTHAFAWGDLGHRAVGEIATQQLNVQAKRMVTLISNGESLAQQSTWADEVRSDESFKWLTLFHFISVDANQFDAEHHDENLVDAYNGIKKNTAILKDPSKSLVEKRQALAILVHLVGDVHQPLHVGYTTDRGGNNCKVEYFGKKTNLHSVLDSGIFEHTGLSFTELARFTQESKRDLFVGEDLNALVKAAPSVWFQESINIRESMYPNKSNTKWTLKSGNTDEYLATHGYCNLPKDAASEMIPSLDYLYNYKTDSVLRRRVLLAGLRLGNLLNEIFTTK